MRPVTVFVLLLFAGGLASGDSCARALGVRCFAEMPAQDAAIVRARRLVLPAAATANVNPDRGRRLAPRSRHRRSVGRRLLPAPRAPDLRSAIA